MSALDHQEGGTHYAKLKIQPIEYIHANGLGFAEGSIIKYVTRWRDKNGIADLKKARHFLDLLIELEQKNHIVESNEIVDEMIASVKAGKACAWVVDKELPSSGIYEQESKLANRSNSQRSRKDVPECEISEEQKKKHNAEIYGDSGYSAEDMKAASLVHDAEPAQCTNSDSWNCKYCRKTESCAALKDPANFAQAKMPTIKSGIDPELVSLCGYTEIHADSDGWIVHVGGACPVSNRSAVVCVKGHGWIDSTGDSADGYDWNLGGTEWRITHWKYK